MEEGEGEGEGEEQEVSQRLDVRDDTVPPESSNLRTLRNTLA